MNQKSHAALPTCQNVISMCEVLGWYRTVLCNICHGTQKDVNFIWRSSGDVLVLEMQSGRGL